MENQFNSQQPQQPVPPQGYPQQPGQPPTQCPNAPWILGIVGFCLMLLGLIILKILQTGVYAQLYPQGFFSRLSRSVEPPSSIWLFYYKFIIFTIYLHLFGGVASLVLSFLPHRRFMP